MAKGLGATGLGSTGLGATGLGATGLGNTGVHPNNDWLSRYLEKGNGNDETGNSNLADTGITYPIDSTRGQIALYDGTTNKQINAGTPSSIGGPMSYSIWFYQESFNNVLLANASTTSHSFVIPFNASSIRVFDASGTLRSYTTTTATATWHQLGLCMDGAKLCKLYIDGGESSTGGITFTTGLDIDAIVGNYAGGSFNWDGKVQNLTVWNRCLTDADMLANYNFELL